MSSQSLDSPTAQRLLTGAKMEVTMVWEMNGILCKARIDALKDNMIIDLKTCNDASKEQFSRDSYNFGYQTQAAWYTMGYRALTGENPSGFVFMAVEKTPPHGVAFYMFNDTTEFEQGCEELLAIYKRCLETEVWPCYSDEIQVLELPRWSKKQ
jgi:hypothetical protein